MQSTRPKASTFDTGWDARNEFVRELVFRVHLWLNGNPQDIKGWFEALRDFYSVACPFIEDREGIQEKIQEIKILIHGNHTTVTTHSRNLDIAYEKIRTLFEIMHIAVFRAGIYLPIYDKEDPGEAVTDIRL